MSNKDATITLSHGNITEGDQLEISISQQSETLSSFEVHIHRDHGHQHGPLIKKYVSNGGKSAENFSFDTERCAAGLYTVQLLPSPLDGTVTKQIHFRIWAKQEVQTEVKLQRAESITTPDHPLWVSIRNRTNAIGFQHYKRFIDEIFRCGEGKYNVDALKQSQASPVSFTSRPESHLSAQGPQAYLLLKHATQAFLVLESGVVIRDRATQAAMVSEDESSTRDATSLMKELESYLVNVGEHHVLPYLHKIAKAYIETKPKFESLPYWEGILQHRLTQPSLIELIWSYWHEEGMLAQTMNAIAFRFQNLRSAPHDPLGELELDPLRPLNNIIWGYVQDRHNRLTIARRAFEYDHHYGVKLVGKAVPAMGSADSRSKFFEAFHNLLYRTAVFYREDAETTVVADAFPLLNALKDVHLLLAEGAHNQYGDLPWTARAEMLTEQWMLARPEMREFLRGRHMVPYQEDWMGAVDAMKKLQGWTDTTITHFNELAVDGERLLLSIRFGDWSDLNLTEDNAKNWARYWKPEVQRYIYGYLAVTGVDLMADTNDSRDAALRTVQPSLLLQRRLTERARPPAIAARPAVARLGVGASGFAAALPGSVAPRALRQLKGQ